MRNKLVVSGFILALFSFPSAQAQVTMDASKITCDQFVHGKAGTPRVVAAWLSGFYNGKRDNALIDTKNFQANLNKLEKFCYDEKNFSLPVMQAIERAIGSAR
jgi:acid stress chaperone HdeB